MARRLPSIHKLPNADQALPGRYSAVVISPQHAVHGRPTIIHFPEEVDLWVAVFCMGDFRGPERLFWQQEGVYTTQVGYTGGYSMNPNHREVLSGRTAHALAIRVFYDPSIISYEELLYLFWENHDPTQGNKQGSDIGTMYRSAIFYFDDEQLASAKRTRDLYQEALKGAGFGEITTEIRQGYEFFYAEDTYQQYYHKYPRDTYKNDGTGVPCPRLSSGE